MVSRILVAFALVVCTATLAMATGSLLLTPGAKVGGGVAIQQCTPTGNINKSLGTKGFKNMTTSSLACIQVQGIQGTTGVAMKGRVGGFSSGSEADFFIVPATGGTYWVGKDVAKYGFQAISSATATRLGGAK